MISEGYLRRHVHAYNTNREVALLDVAEEYILEFMRRQGFFDGILVFKGGTALRKYVFGPSGRFSTDLDFGLVADDPGYVNLVFDTLDGANLLGVRVRLENRDAAAARLRIDTDLGPVDVPAAISVRDQAPWLPAVHRRPEPFEFLDRGLAGDFSRASLPILDLREITAEKIAAFWRRRKARDLYDLEHLGRALQAEFDGLTIGSLAALKVYFDVVDEGLGHPPTDIRDIFRCTTKDVEGIDDLGRFQARATDAGNLLAQCSQRYSALPQVDDGILRVVTTCSLRDRYRALELRDSLVSRLVGPTPSSHHRGPVIDEAG